MSASDFIGRKTELALLSKLRSKDSASLVVVKGRRRVGKSRLLQEYGSQFKKAYYFSGLPPAAETSAQDQRDEFSMQFSRQFKSDLEKKMDWGDIFWLLSERVRDGDTLVVLDEITWMGSADINFLGKLKTAWDLYFKENANLVLVLCGSISVWIEQNILSSTGFLGRESLTLTVEEMPMRDAVKFWGDQRNRISAYEKLKVLSVTGGIPRYLEHVDPVLEAEENIRSLCFESSGILFEEFEKIFSDLFDGKASLYRQIMDALLDGSVTQESILHYLKQKKSGRISAAIENLIKSGFVARDFTWNLKSGKPSNLSHYRIRDNYSRFYLKYIFPNKEKIRIAGGSAAVSAYLKNWYTTLGLQFENLVLANRHEIKKLLGINPADVVVDNPFFQRQNNKQKGCQIDYLIQTRHKTLYVIEIKFSGRQIGLNIVDEMEQKLSRFSIPRGFSVRTALVHVNGVTEALEDQRYFSYIIDFSDLLGE